MPITFKSQATGDLVMLNAHAEALLKLLGKTVTAAGIIEAADMPHALSVLRAIEDPRHAQATARAERNGHEADSAGAADAEAESDAESPGLVLPFQDEPVSLHQRAVPLIRLIEQALAEGKPIVWGV